MGDMEGGGDMESGDEYLEADSGDAHEFESDMDDDYEDDDDGDNDDLFPDEGIDNKETDDFKYDILEPEKIAERMMVMIKQVSEVVQLPGPKCRHLLHHFKWNPDRVLEKYYSSCDPEQFLNHFQVGSPSTSRQTLAAASAIHGTFSASSSSSSHHNAPQVLHRVQQQSCQICFLDIPIQKMTGMECGHEFCEDCWSEYIRVKVMEEGEGETISCPMFKCQILVDDALVMRLIKENKVRRRYTNLITNSFVECNDLLRWCPKADCGRVIEVNHNEVKPVTCKCATVFCFGCGDEWHEPVTCRLLRLWLKKCNDDSETSNWIAANTKECPKCNVTIEKDGGCNHMTCKNSACRNEFCWVCQGPWEPHGSSWYACNRYDDKAGKDARNQQEKSRAALQRYLHYCNRYMNHMQSMRFEHKLYATVKHKMEQMQAAQMSWIEVQFLKAAVDVLCASRRTLMYTYVFAYYLVNNNQSKIFEDNQGDLEMATEQLSEFLERDLEKENLTSLKQKVQDNYRYCEQRRKKMLEHCKEGMEKDWWEYFV